LRTKSSSSRSRSAFTFRSSSRSIFAWTTMGSETPSPAATGAHGSRESVP
jgi:hypothetical protein